MVSLPPHNKTDEGLEFIIDKGVTGTIIFKIEDAVKDVLLYLAKSDNQYGNSYTAVLAEMITTHLKERHNYTFDRQLNALNHAYHTPTSGDGIPYAIKSAYENAVKDSNPANFAEELSAGLITAAEVNERVTAANGIIMSIISKGYNPNDFTSNKKSFGYKWGQGSWIWEVSRKSSEEETVTIEGKEVTRLKKLDIDSHYLNYTDNGIELICPHIFVNALYMRYQQRDDYFNRELRKVSLQHAEYKKDGKEYEYIIDECCPTSKVELVKTMISTSGVEVIGAHLVKLNKKGMRQYRFVCLDLWDKTNDTYKEVVFMNDRGMNNTKTATTFFEVFEKVPPKTRKQRIDKPDVKVALPSTSVK